MSKKTAANLLMVFGTMIWGAAFVAQSIGAEHIGPYTFGCLRFFLGALVLLPVMYLSRKKNTPAPDAKDEPRASYLRAGLICGTALFLGALFQQYGIMNTTVGKAGFITALYVVLVPIFGFFLYKRRIHKNVVAAIFLAIAGAFLLCVTEALTVNKGDMLTFVGSVFWAVQILCIERFAQKLDGLRFAFLEFLTCSVLNGVFMVLVDKPAWAQISAAAIPILYSGLLSVGVGFTAQIVCLRYTDPTAASLIMSLESVFSVIFGFLILHQVLTLRQGIGCILVFCAVVLAQLLPKGARVVAETPSPEQ